MEQKNDWQGAVLRRHFLLRTQTVKGGIGGKTKV